MKNQDNEVSHARPIKLLVTIAEACDSLGVKRTSMYEYIRAGRIRTVKIGSRGIRVPVTELERFVAEGLG